MSTQRKLITLLLFVFVWLLVACGPAESPPAVPIPTTPPDKAYPAPESVSQPEEAYPMAGEESQSGILLAFNKPIEPGATLITGVGPPGLSILILNVTFMGAEIGTGVIDDDGTFAIEVDPIPAAVRIGLTADLEADGLVLEDIRPADGAISVPQVGYFFDSYVVAGTQ